MSCEHYERTSAFLDGELDAAASTEAERHIEACPHCQGLVASASDASELLRGTGARLTAPASLRARIEAALEAETTVSPRPARRDRFWLGAASGAGVSAVAASLVLVAAPLLTAQSYAESLTEAHVDALMTGRTVAVVSSNHHTVKPWFAGRAPLSPPVADLAADGFPLAGGRVDEVKGKPVAVLAYRHGAHEIDLFVWPAERGRAPARAERRGYRIVSWTKDDLAFAAVSDVQASELERFVGLVQAERE